MVAFKINYKFWILCRTQENLQLNKILVTTEKELLIEIKMQLLENNKL